MDRSSRTGTLRLVVENEANENQDLSERVDENATVADVARRWEERYRVDSERLQLLTPTLDRLADATPLSDLRDESRLLHLLVRVAVDVEVALCGSAAPSRRAAVFLSSSPSQVLPDLRALVGLPEPRPLRLCTASGELLDPDKPLQEQGVETGSRLLLDPGFRVSVTEFWDRQEETMTCFGTQAVIPSLVDGVDLVELLREDETKVPLSATVGKAFEVPEGLPEEEYCLRAVRMRRITVQKGRQLKQRVLLPKDSPQLLPESLISEEGRPMSVRLSSGQRKIVRVPGPATVADLHRELARLEDGDFVLTSRGQPLYPLAWLDGVGDGEIAVRRQEPLSVTILLSGGGEATYVPGGGTTLVQLSDLRRQVDGATTFSCCGCQRRIFCEEQRVPVACCSLQSLRLRCETQTDQVFQDATVQCNILEVGVNVETQTEERKAAAGQQFNSSFLKKVVTVDVVPDSKSKQRAKIHLEPHHDLNAVLQLTSDKLNVPRGSLSYVYQFGGHYIAGDRTYTQSAYLQADDRFVHAYGHSLQGSRRIANFQRPLQSLSEVTFIPDGRALFLIDLDCNFLSFDDDGRETRLGRECLHDPKYVAWIEGHMLTFGKDGGQTLLLDSTSDKKSLFRTSTVDVETGRAFLDCRDAIAKHRQGSPDGNSVNFAYIMLKAGTQLPKWKVPKGQLLFIFLRRDVRLSLDPSGVVRVDVIGRPSPDWVFEPSNDSFRRTVTNYFNS